MAPVGERNDRLGSSTPDDDENEGQNLWSTILGEVQSSSSTNLPTSKSILALGDTECGKTTLIAKLQATEEPKKGTGLEYYYIDVKDEYRDDQTRLGVWVLDGDTTHTSLLKYCITEENFEHSLVVLMASMSQPWSILESLDKWANVLQHHIDRMKLPPEDRREYEESLVRYFQEYVEPVEGQTTQSAPRRDHNPLHPPAVHSDSDKVQLPLGENSLTHNLGIPIVVVLTQSDAISKLEKEHDYREEHFDFIQQHVRKFCLKFQMKWVYLDGASLVYTSVKEEKNCDLLYRYLVHRIYGFPFDMPAYVVEKDSVFVPAGWDNEKKISILFENLHNMKPDDAYEDKIAKPKVGKQIQRDAEVAVEDEQVFLLKQQTTLNKTPAPGPGGESPQRPPAASPKKTAYLLNAEMLSNRIWMQLKLVLPVSDKAAVSQDAAAELERMRRTKKAIPEVKPNGPDSTAT
ncbi:dynein light intermediate chain 1, cytosolic [Mytilus galloprovincialis]|uniref:Dynein light intermediate chain n=1 Tax=Mytilus galloprovincialis TaxID=29158 RepID=A0A8B6FD29_MYTGA|nr:dynein light intermediate chain 1, cytosolic [Mytilus galloprovincialis]